MTSINTQDTTNKPTITRNLLGIAGGVTAAYAGEYALSKIRRPYIKHFIKNINQFNPIDNETLIAEADRMVQESKITKKGFQDITLVKPREMWEIPGLTSFKKLKLSDLLTPLDENSINTSFSEYCMSHNPARNELYKNCNYVKKQPLAIKDAGNKYRYDIIKTYQTGNTGVKARLWFETITNPLKKISDLMTASYIPYDSKIEAGVTTGMFNLISNNITSGSPNSLLHEVGHAINKNKNILTKFPQTFSTISSKVLIPFVILNALFTNKPKKDENENNNNSIFNKVREFTRKHVGLTVAGLWAPILLEESLATTRAIKFVNKSKAIKENVKKQHNKCLKIAFGTYILAAVSSGALAQLAVFVKDKIVEYKPKQKRNE